MDKKYDEHPALRLQEYEFTEPDNPAPSCSPAHSRTARTPAGVTWDADRSSHAEKVLH